MEHGTIAGKIKLPPFIREGFIVFFSSLIIALLVQTFNHNPINVDGILYLETAKLYGQQGLHAATALYPWPFYPILLYILSQHLHVDLFPLAFWLNNIFITLMIFFWIALLKELAFSRKILWGGMLLILLYPSLNHLRNFVIRDTGYFAFLFAGCWCLFQYLKFPRITYAFLFSLSMGIAALFRIEGIVIWGGAPLIFLAIKSLSFRQKTRYLIINEISFIIIILTLLGWKLSSPHHHFSQLGRLSDFWTIFKQHTQLFATHFSLSFLGNFFTTFFNTLNPLYACLIGWAFIKRTLPPPSAQRTLLTGILLLQFFIPLVFYFQTGITTDRYLLPLCLTLSLFAPFALPRLTQKLGIPVLIIFSIMAYSGIHPFGPSKSYLVDAGDWLKQHTKPSDKIYSNSREVLFYAGSSTIDWQMNESMVKILLPLQSDVWKSYNYLAIRLNKKDNEAQQLTDRLALQPIKIFRNNRDDKVKIFYVPH